MSKDLILDGDSDYATLGAPDTYTARVDGIGGSLLRAGDVNGVVKAMTEAQTLLGNALALKGVRTDLVARLAQILADDGSLRNGTSFPSTPVPLVGDLFYRTDGAKTLYIYDGTAWKTMFEGGGGGSIDHGTLSGLADSDHAAHIDVDGSKDFTGEQQMEMATPRFRFKGTEANAVEYGIGEDGGLFYIWENIGTEGTPSWFARFAFDTSGAAFTLTGTSITLPPILTPTIASMVNATHDHVDGAGGGLLGADSVGITQLKIAAKSFVSASYTGSAGTTQTFATGPYFFGDFTIDPSLSNNGNIQIVKQHTTADGGTPTRLWTLIDDGVGGGGTVTVTVSWNEFDTVV